MDGVAGDGVGRGVSTGEIFAAFVVSVGVGAIVGKGVGRGTGTEVENDGWGVAILVGANVGVGVGGNDGVGVIFCGAGTNDGTLELN